MRRLSIIDLLGEHQPIHNEERNAWVVFIGSLDYRSDVIGARHRPTLLVGVSEDTAMLRFGILTAEQYAKATSRRRLTGSGVSLNLLELSDHPAREEILRFEEISAGLRTSVGTTRMTFRRRMVDVDEVALRLMRQNYRPDNEVIVQDRAASNCLTSTEWADQILAVFPRAHFEASDRLLYLFRISLPRGRTYFVEPGGQPLQYVKSPFVVCLYPREPYRYVLNQLIAGIAKWSFRRLSLPGNLADSTDNEKYRVDKISCIHPEAHILIQRDPRFTVCERSVFQRTQGLDVLRTMNILNLAYFSQKQLEDGIQTASESLKPGGLWIVGRTLEKNQTNHVTYFRRTDKKWEVLERIGNGSEIEELVMRENSARRNDE
jgi:hypothetical protein